MNRIFNRYSNQLAILFGRAKFLVTTMSLVVCITPLFVFSQSLPIIDNSNDLLGLSPLSINNYVQCTIKYLQNSTTLIKIVQEKNNRISFYQKSLRDLIDTYNKLYNTNQLIEAQELIQEIQKIRIFSSRLSKSLEIGIDLNKQIIRETQKKPCYLNSLQSVETSQSNIIIQSINLEQQLSNNLENAYRLISQTESKKSQHLINDLNSSSSSSEMKSESSNSSSNSSDSSSSSSVDSSQSVSPIESIPVPVVPRKIQPIYNKPESQSSEPENISSQSSVESVSSSSIGSSSSSTPTSSSSVSSSESSISIPPVSSSVSSSSSSAVDSSKSEPSSLPSSASNLISDDDLGSLATDKPSTQTTSSSSTVNLPSDKPITGFSAASTPPKAK